MNHTITLTVACCLLPIKWVGAEQPLPHRSPQALPASEAKHRQMLEVCRRDKAQLQEYIAFQEKTLAEFGNLFTPEQKRRLQTNLEYYRNELKKLERLVLELERYEAARKLNPGAATDDEWVIRLQELLKELWGPPPMAPMPREVTR